MITLAGSAAKLRPRRAIEAMCDFSTLHCDALDYSYHNPHCYLYSTDNCYRGCRYIHGYNFKYLENSQDDIIRRRGRSIEDMGGKEAGRHVSLL